jgi:DNA-binding CsgD family transcriptional regulator
VAILGIMAPRLAKPDPTPARIAARHAPCTFDFGGAPAYGADVGNVSIGDYERILEIVAESAAGTAEEPVPMQALDMIRRLVPCDVVALIDGYPWDRVNRRTWISGWVAPWSTEDRRIVDRYRSQVPLGPSPATIHGPVRISDAMSRSRYRRTDLYQLAGRSHGVEYSMDHWLPGRAGRMRGLTFDATVRDFSDRDRDVVEVLGRHLATVIGRLDSTLPLAPPRRILTSRQAEILSLVADGRTNHQIARALSISPLTVKKHLENVFGVMEVHGRAAAIGALYGRARPPSRGRDGLSAVGAGLEL